MSSAVPEHTLHESDVAIPKSGHAVGVMVRIAYTMGGDEPKGTVEAPDRGGVRHGNEHTSKGIDFDRPKERDREPEKVFQVLRAIWELARDPAPRFGRECRPATPMEACGNRTQE
jgi:hypothetical protein